MYTLRIHSVGDRPAPSRELRFDTKRELLAEVRRMGKLSFIRKVEPRVYSIRPAPKK